MIEILIFVVGSMGIVLISIPSLRQPGSHGFFRFFAWEIILGLFALNMGSWFVNPYSWNQIISWILLAVCLIPILYGAFLLRTAGKPTDQLEATTQLVSEGIYHYIRHPLYASLIYLTWGIFFKSPSWFGLCLAVVSMFFLYATALADEAECLVKFGDKYASYMKKTKMFIPFVF